MPTVPPPVALLSAADVERCLGVLPLLAAVEDAFRAQGAGAPQPGGVLGLVFRDGKAHCKAAALHPDRGVLAVKLNLNYPENPASSGLPTIQGLVIVSDVRTGVVRAVVDSPSLTRLRTAAASAVAIRHLARADATDVLLIGCGAQAFDHVRFAKAVRPLRTVTLIDTDRRAAEALAGRVRRELSLTAEVREDISAAAPRHAIIITCTTAQRPILALEDVSQGALVVAVGADNPQKHELAPSLLAGARVITDSTAQCAGSGDLHHALTAGAMTVAEVYAELGAVVAGRRPGRTSDSDRIVFDSTGLPFQDAAAAELLVAQLGGEGAVPTFDFTEGARALTSK